MPTLTNVNSLYEWVMALLRAGALVSVLPVFSAQPVPVQLRLVLAVFLAYLSGTFAPVHPIMPEHPIALAIVSANEALIGLFMGLMVRIISFAAEMAGQIIASEIGLTSGNTFDPNSGNSFASPGIMLTNLAAVLLLTTGGYHAVLFAYLRSYAVAPVGDLGFRPGALDLFVTQTGSIFALAVEMSAPVMAVNFVMTLTFAVLGKVAPGINAFAESYPARILAGMTVLGMTLTLSAQYMLGYLSKAPDLMLQLVRR